MVKAAKSATLMKHQSGKPMMDTGKRVVAPGTGKDADGNKRMGGNAMRPDRDGPAKRSANPEPPTKKPQTSAKAAKMAAPKTVQKAPIKVAPKESGMPQGTMQAMPSPAMLGSMKRSLKGGAGKFTR